MSKLPFVIDGETGQPFASEALAWAKFRKDALDKSKETVVKYQGGYAIVDIAVLAEMASTPPSPPAPVPDTKMKYSIVNFNQRQSANEVAYVPLTHNGLELRVQRGVDVCLPHSFIEIARHAEMTNWDCKTGDPNIPVKAAGKLQRFPFRIVRESNETEFNKCLAEGNAITNDFMERLKRK